MKQTSMERKILSYSISLLLCLFIALPLAAQQNYSAQSASGNRPQREKKKEKKKPEVVYPLYNGTSISLDLWGPGSKLFGSDNMSAEAIVDVDLKHRYFPTLELGYGASDSWNEQGIHYKTGAPYFRIGADYNALYNKKHGHMILVGLRYGFTSFNYDVTALGLDDPIYGGGVDNPNLGDDIWGGSVAYNHTGMKASMHWAEFNVGIRANVGKSISMGWSLRMRFRLSASTDKYGDPWYVPGFGKYGSKSTGIYYTITYKLPYQHK